MSWHAGSGGDAGTDAVAASLTIANDWGGGYCATVTVVNNGSAAVNWHVTLTVEGTVDGLWNGLWSQSGSILEVEGVAWNATLDPGEVDSSVGFCASR